MILQEVSDLINQTLLNDNPIVSTPTFESRQSSYKLEATAPKPVQQIQPQYQQYDSRMYQQPYS